MNTILRHGFLLALLSVICGVTAHRLSAGSGPNYFCSEDQSVQCPDPAICHLPAHCGLTPFHKSVNSNTYATCVLRPGSNCPPAPNGCRFEEYTLNCGAATGIILTPNPRCYGECGLPL